MTGVIIPFYIYPGQSGMVLYNQVIAQKLAHPSVPFIVIINPNSGSGGSMDSNFVAAIKKLQSAGIRVLGYVYTRSATRDLAVIKSEIKNYHDWYSVDGINFDEFSTHAGNEVYYQDLVSYCTTLGINFTVGNPGALTSLTYADMVDVLTIYESSGLPGLATLQAREQGFDIEDFGYLSHDTPTLDKAAVLSTIPYVDWLYVTNDIEPNPWNTLPPYFGDLITLLDGAIIPPVIVPPIPVQPPKPMNFSGTFIGVVQ